MGRDYRLLVPSPMVALAACSMLLEATIIMMMALVMVVIMRTAIIDPWELCYKAIAILIIAFATAQKWFQVLQPRKDLHSLLLWAAKEKPNKRYRKEPLYRVPPSRRKAADLTGTHLSGLSVITSPWPGQHLVIWGALQTAGWKWKKELRKWPNSGKAGDARCQAGGLTGIMEFSTEVRASSLPICFRLDTKLYSDK